MSTVRLRPLVKSISPAFPVVFGYLPIGFAYGVLANNAGLSIFQTVLMSIIVYAGSSQLIAVSYVCASRGPLFHYHHHLYRQFTAYVNVRRPCALLTPLEKLAGSFI